MLVDGRVPMTSLATWHQSDVKLTLRRYHSAKDPRSVGSGEAAMCFVDNSSDSRDISVKYSSDSRSAAAVTLSSSVWNSGKVCIGEVGFCFLVDGFYYRNLSLSNKKTVVVRVGG